MRSTWGMTKQCSRRSVSSTRASGESGLRNSGDVAMRRQVQVRLASCLDASCRDSRHRLYALQNRAAGCCDSTLERYRSEPRSTSKLPLSSPTQPLSTTSEDTSGRVLTLPPATSRQAAHSPFTPPPPRPLLHVTNYRAHATKTSQDREDQTTVN